MAFAHDFYVWQRKWNEPVEAAVRQELDRGDHGLYILGGEIEYEGEKAVWKNVFMPDGLWTNAQVTAVLRLPVKALENPKASAQAVIEQARKLAVKRIQLDVDVPERKLHRYAELIAAVRSNSAWRFDFIGATFLPCHLDHNAIVEVLALVDEPVIQLHGIDPPKCRADGWSLMNRKTVLTAMKSAKKLDARFKMALPTYAYILFFKKDGLFRRLYAEGLRDDSVVLKAEESPEIAAPDLTLLHELMTSSDALRVLWFRLPVSGSDRWTLSKETILALERGELPKPGLEIEMRRVSPTVVDVAATYRHQIPLHETEVTLDWGGETKGEFFPMNATRVADGSVYGTLPEKLYVAPYSSGQSFILGKAIKESK